MRKIAAIWCIILLFVVSGCNSTNEHEVVEDETIFDTLGEIVNEGNPKNLPQVRAFQDEYTRDFMQSTEEVKEGYYTFQSKTGGYTMNYPADTKLNPVFYSRNDKNFEFIQFAGSEEPTSKLTYFVRATYINDKAEKPASLSTLLKMLSTDIQYEGDYEQLSLEDNEIYHGTKYFSLDSMESKYYYVFGLVKSNSMNKSVSLLYAVKCERKGEASKDVEENIKNEALDLMKSVQFKSDEI